MHHPRFQDKVVLITGGNSGLGLAAAKAFAAEGARVIITGRNEASLAAAAREIGLDTLALRSDTSDLAQIAPLMEQIKAKYDRIDVLFANAGVARFGALRDVTEALYDEVMDINVKGLFFTVQKALPLMPSGASIILNASAVACKGVPNGAVYAASKAAIRSLGRSFAAALLARDIRVNVVSPGPIETPIFDRAGMSAEHAAGFRNHLQQTNPQKRFGQPSEVASGVLFLASSEASYITGIELNIDGGAVNL